MSRIFEAIQNARKLRVRLGPDGSDRRVEMEQPERCANPWSELGIQLTVYGRSACECPFYEEAKAIDGNADGGLFLLSIPVREGQDLLLINNNTATEQLCKVRDVRVRDIQTSEVSVSFPSPNPAFWQPATAES